MQTEDDGKRIEDERFEMLYINKLKRTKKERIEKCMAKFNQAKTIVAKTSAAAELRALARSEQGLIDTNIRSQAWPILLNIEAIVKNERAEQNLPAIVWPLKDSTEWRNHLKDYADRH